MNLCGFQAVSCIEGLLSNEKQTTVRLFDRIKEKLGYLSYRFNSSQAEEVFSEVYLKLYALKIRNPQKIEEISGCCITYMTRMASNWFIDQTKVKDKKHVELSGNDAQILDTADSDFEYMERLEKALAQCEDELSDRQRIQWIEYKKLKYFEGKSSEEIYKQLGRSSSNALDVWAHGVTRSLRNCAKGKFGKS